MRQPPRRPHRWSKKTDQLVGFVASRCRPSLQTELARWIEHSPRFAAFVTSNQDKIRKKFNSAEDAEARLDVRAELLVAYALLADRRFDAIFEAYGAQQRGPDLAVTYRTNQRFNLEVTRLRATREIDDAGDEVDVARLANLIARKLRQLPGDVPNALVITTDGLPPSEQQLSAAAQWLKLRAEQRDEAFFVRRGFRNTRDFHVQFVRLSGVLAVDEATSPPRIAYATNPQARHPLPADALQHLLACVAA